MPRGSLSRAHADGLPCDARHSSFLPGKIPVRLTSHLLRMSHIQNSVRPTSHLLQMSHIRNSVRRQSTFSGCLTSGILSANIPLSPDVSHPEFCPADVPPSPDVSHPKFCSANVPHSPDVSHPEFCRPTSHLFRMSHIRNSVRRQSTFSGCLTSGILSAYNPPSPDVSHLEFCPADVPPSPDVSHPKFCPSTIQIPRTAWLIRH